MFGVITGASGAVLSSNVYDSFMGMQYVQGVSKTTQPATCYKAMSEPGLLTGSGGRGVVVPSRGFQVMGKTVAPAKKHAYWITPLPNFMCMSVCTNTHWGMENPSFCQAFCEGLYLHGCTHLYNTCIALGDDNASWTCIFLYFEFCEGE